MAPFMASMQLMTMARALAGPREPRGPRRLPARRPAEHVPTALERQALAEAEEAVRARIGDEAYTAAYEEGGGLTIEEADRPGGRVPVTPSVPGGAQAFLATPSVPGAQAFLRNLATASGAITTVIPAAQASVHQTESPTGLPCMRARAASARLESGL
ncbi:hypothetical protein SMICM304S_09432 [Streptomyces microflavus]